MNRNLIFTLVLVFAVMLVGCSGTVPTRGELVESTVTAEPTRGELVESTTVIPTVAPTETAVPSPTPAAKPTGVPTPTATFESGAPIAACPSEVVNDPSLAPLVCLGCYTITQVASWEVREAPAMVSSVMEVLPVGASYHIIGGPACVDQLVWFQIDSPLGWVPFALLIGDDLFLVPH